MRRAIFLYCEFYLGIPFCHICEQLKHIMGLNSPRFRCIFFHRESPPTAILS